MGKLHTLRRAIERDPSKWYEDIPFRYGVYRRPYSAHYRRGKWRRDTIYGGSYLKFVRSVLCDLGIML